MTDSPPLQADEILRRLAENEVEFVVIGGLAVGFHGFTRATKDLDIVPGPDRDNLERLLDTLMALDAQLEPIDIPEHGQALDVDWLEEGGNFIFQTSHGRFDVLQEVSGLTYRELAEGAEQDEVFGVPVRVVSYPILVKLKEAAGRDQDLIDLQRLREARGEEP